MRKVLSACLLAALTVAATIGTPAHAEDTGVIACRFTDNGAPVVGASVSAQPESTSSPGGSATTDADGRYRIVGLLPGRYRVAFMVGEGPAQYAFGKTNYSSAALITVTAGTVSTVDDSRLPTGVIRGTFNSPMPDTTRVHFFPEYGSGGGHRQQVLSGDGQFSAALFPGRYKTWFVVDQPSGQPGAPYIQYAGGTDVSQ